MTARVVLGASLLLLLLVAVLAATVWATGSVRLTAEVWGVSVAFTGLVVLAHWLLTGSLT